MKIVYFHKAQEKGDFMSNTKVIGIINLMGKVKWFTLVQLKEEIGYMAYLKN